MMFEQYDLSKKTDDRTYEKSIAPPQIQLGVLQRSLRDHKIPTIIVVEGWNASGIMMVIHELIQFLDPRGFSLHSTGSPTDEERTRPFLWRFWIKPPRGGVLRYSQEAGTAAPLPNRSRVLTGRERTNNQFL